MSEKTFIGIDPSLTSSGVVALDSEGEVVLSETVGTEPTEQRICGELSAMRDRSVRTKEIASNLLGLVAQTSKVLPKDPVWAMEYGGPSYNSYDRCALHISISGVFGCLPYPVNASQLKKFCGASDKSEVRLEVKERWGERFDTTDETDAYVLARMAREIDNLGPDTDLYKYQLEALHKSIPDSWFDEQGLEIYKSKDARVKQLEELIENE